MKILHILKDVVDGVQVGAWYLSNVWYNYIKLIIFHNIVMMPSSR